MRVNITRTKINIKLRNEIIRKVKKLSVCSDKFYLIFCNTLIFFLNVILVVPTYYSNNIYL